MGITILKTDAIIITTKIDVLALFDERDNLLSFVHGKTLLFCESPRDFTSKATCTPRVERLTRKLIYEHHKYGLSLKFITNYPEYLMSYIKSNKEHLYDLDKQA